MQHIFLSERKFFAVQCASRFVDVVHDDVHRPLGIRGRGEEAKDIHLRLSKNLRHMGKRSRTILNGDCKLFYSRHRFPLLSPAFYIRRNELSHHALPRKNPLPQAKICPFHYLNSRPTTPLKSGPLLRFSMNGRFGLEDGSQHTLEEVGQLFALTRERIRQIEGKALRKLRHSSRSHKLRAFLELALRE